MDHLMAEKLTKIIRTAKWGKSHQKKYILRCLANRMWPADQTLPRPGLDRTTLSWHKLNQDTYQAQRINLVFF